MDRHVPAAVAVRITWEPAGKEFPDAVTVITQADNPGADAHRLVIVHNKLKINKNFLILSLLKELLKSFENYSYLWQ